MESATPTGLPVGDRDGSTTTASAERPGDPVTTLRGAGVSVDRRVVGRVGIGTFLAGMLVAIVALFVAGAHKNAQVDELHKRGVPVEATVTGCIGLMGGSGSNLVGYDCRADYTLGGHHYSEPLAGTTTPTPGAKFRAVAVPGDPGLLATVSTVAAEQASWRVFVLPIALVLVLTVVLIALDLARRRAGRRTPNRPPHVERAG